MPRKSTRSKRRQAPSKRRRIVIGGLLLLGAAFAAYIAYLNHLINARFEGDTWALPSRVYSRALEIYPGLALARSQLEYELELSAYLEVRGDPFGHLHLALEPALVAADLVGHLGIRALQ